jgi:hypothetical protein
MALVGCSALPFVVFRANRIVAGSPRSIAEGGVAGWALAVLAVAALVGALALATGVRVLACAAGMLGALAGSRVRGGRVDAASRFFRARVIGAGAGLRRLELRSCGLVALQADLGVAACRRRRPCGGWLARVWGGWGRLSIALSTRCRSTPSGALTTHLVVAGTRWASRLQSACRRRARRVVAAGGGSQRGRRSRGCEPRAGAAGRTAGRAGLPGIRPCRIIALTLYALLPIVRNTYVGLSAVDPGVVDAGRGMGMSRTQLLLRVEAPLALPLFIEGVRAATVLIIGITAVVAFIGVGTLGVLVFLGWGQQADDLTLLGAVPMVVLAVGADALLRSAGRLATSPGIRMEAGP